MDTTMDEMESRFQAEIYREHLTQIGFYLDQRCHCFADENFTWVEVIEIEERLRAHLQGIHVGSDLAKECSIEFLKFGDDDELTGAVHALASIHHGQTEHLDILLEHFIQADDAQLGSYVEALKHATHPQLAHHLTQLLTHERPILGAAAAEILGYRREGDAKRLWPLLRHADEMVRGATVIALVRYGDRSALPAIEQALLDSGTLPQHDWLLPLLLLGSRRALSELTHTCSLSDAATPVGLMCLAMSAGREAFVILARSVQFPEMKAHAYAALGIFGDVNGVPHLLDGLRSKEEGERLEAAKALQLITGAGLIETVTVVEPPEDELTPEDVTGAPKPPVAEEPATPATQQIQRVCTQFEPWQRWWHAHTKAFNASPRWRHGQAFTLQICIDDLANPSCVAQARQHAHMELLIRSGRSIPFEPDAFIPKQLQAIAAWRAWWQGAMASFTNNPWTFDGR